MTTFTTAMTVLMVIIALGQLAINITALSARSRKAIVNWAVIIFQWVMFLLSVAMGAFAISEFFAVTDPGRREVLLLVSGAFLIAQGFALTAAFFFIRQIRRLDNNLNLLHKHLGYPYEPWRKGSDG